jgi:hypothetical protein
LDGEPHGSFDRAPSHTLSEASDPKSIVTFDLFSIPTSILFPELTQKKQTQPKITYRLGGTISIGRGDL